MIKFEHIVFVWGCCLLLRIGGGPLMACDSSTSTLNSLVSNGDGTYTADFTVCFAGSNESNGASHGIEITVTGANINSVAPTSITSTNTTTLNSVIAGGSVSFGDWSDTTVNFVGLTDPQECFNINLVLDAVPTDWSVYGQEVFEQTTGPPADRGLVGCETIGIFPAVCEADAGSNTSTDPIEVCAGQDASVTATNTVLGPGTNPCIGWGFWVASDPLGVFTGLSGIGNSPTGGFPIDDPNFVGVWSSLDYPLASGENATLPAENNGVTYYIAPITMSDCETSEIDASCFDVGGYTELYFNPAINYTFAIACDNPATPSTTVAILVTGGLPAADGSNFTVTDGGAGTVSPVSVGDGGIITVSGIPDGGTVVVTVTDGLGCNEVITIGPIATDDHCVSCGADAGDIDVAQTGDGNTSSQNGTNSQGPFYLCRGDSLSLDAVGNGTPPPAATCSPPPSCLGSGFMYVIHDEPPVSGDPFDLVTATGFGTVTDYSSGTWSVTNDGSLLDFLEANDNPPWGDTVVDNTLWFVLTTADWYNAGFFNYDNDGDSCFDIGIPVEAVFLNDIEVYAVQSCDGVAISLTGGSPEFTSDNYVVTTSAGVLSNGFPGHGETFYLTGLDENDNFTLTIQDLNGCPATYSGTYTIAEPVPTVSLPASVCETGSAVAVTGSPLPAAIPSSSNTFSGTGGSIPDDDLDGITSTATASGFNGGTLDANTDITVSVVGMAHTWIGDLTVTVTSPCGSSIILTDPEPNNSENFTGGTYTFDMTAGATIPVTAGGSPNVGGGTYLPEEDFAAFIGCNLDGDWTLNIYDDFTGDVGSFTSWSVTLTQQSYATTGSFSGPGITDNGDGTASFDPTAVSAGDIDVTYSYANGLGCLVDTTVSITVSEAPIALISGGGSACASAVHPDISVALSGTSPWSITYAIDGLVQPAITGIVGTPYVFEAPSAGTYTITAVSDVSCSGNGGGSAMVTLRPYATGSFNDTICANSIYTLPSGTDVFGPGSYPDTIAGYDCDSIVTVTLSTTPSSLYHGLYAATSTDYNQVNPLTGAVINSYAADPNTLGWVNGAFTVHEQAATIYWISDQLELQSLNLVTGVQSSTATSISSLAYFWGLRYYNGYLYTLTRSGDNDKKLVRIDPGTGTLDGGFPGIEINGSAGYDVSAGASPVVNPLTGLLYIPMYGNALLAFNIAGGTGSIISLTGYVVSPGSVELLEINEFTGQMYGFSRLTDLVSISSTGTVALIKTLTKGSGYSNMISAFDSDNGLYIFQAQTGSCGQDPLIAVDVSTGQEWCSATPASGYIQLEYLNCKPSATLRIPPEGLIVSIYPNPVDEQLILEMDLFAQKEVQVGVYDVSGALSKEVSVPGYVGTNRLQLNLAELSRGIYIVHVQQGTKRFVGKVFKL